MNDRDSINMAPADNTQVGRVAVKAPPFWQDEPELWFAQLEGQFSLSGINKDETMYAYALAYIDATNAKEVITSLQQTINTRRSKKH